MSCASSAGASTRRAPRVLTDSEGITTVCTVLVPVIVVIRTTGPGGSARRVASWREMTLRCAPESTMNG